MAWLQQPGADEACGAPMGWRDMILPRVEACITAVTPRVGWAREDGTHLHLDLWLTGEGIARLGELLEEEFGVTLLPSALIDLALTNPTLGGVLRMLERAGA